LKKILQLFVLVLLTACTSSLPVIQTGNSGEYLVISKNAASVFSSLEEAQKEAVTQAMNYCKGMGKKYEKKYAIDRPMALGQFPESSLYFMCTETGNESQSATSRSSILFFDQAKEKCIELGFKPATEAFGNCVLKLAK
jgi:hypothetical protein